MSYEWRCIHCQYVATYKPADIERYQHGVDRRTKTRPEPFSSQFLDSQEEPHRMNDKNPRLIELWTYARLAGCSIVDLVDGDREVPFSDLRVV